MKLSMAIRLGALMKPQGFGNFYTDDGGSCGVGAALDAAGASDAWRCQWPKKFLKLFPVAATNIQLCPECHLNVGGAGLTLTPGKEWAVWFLVPHLNDHHKWTREAIADWVATIEQQLEATTAPACELEHAERH